MPVAVGAAEFIVAVEELAEVEDEEVDVVEDVMDDELELEMELEVEEELEKELELGVGRLDVGNGRDCEDVVKGTSSPEVLLVPCEEVTGKL